MLTSLNINGMAVIDSLAIDFDDALNVITGETGAGKSIIIKALVLVTGGKASADVVRSGCSQAVVTGTFRVPARHKAIQCLESLGILCPYDGGEHLIFLRRHVTSTGKSLAWVNDVPVTLQVLRNVGQLVVDILGQQDNMRLLDPAQHLNYLDLFLTNHAPLEDVGRLFNAIMDVVRGIERRLESYHAARSSEDYLEFRARELSDFSPNLEDYEQALSLCERAGTLKAKQEFLSRAQAMIDEGANAEPLSLRVWDAVRTLEKLGDIGSIRPLIGMAQEAADLLDQLSFKLCQAASEVDFSEEDLGPANERIATYQDFFRKFGVTTVPDLVAEQERLSADLALLRNLASELAADISTLAASVKHLDQRSLDLSKERKKAAKTLSRRVETELGELNMPDSTFAVELTAVNRIPPSLDFKGLDPALSEAWTKLSPSLAACGESGRDKVQFLLSANKGEKPLPLQRTASGGELSRIMLAIKKALAAGAETCVLVFDEIDTGISGKTADIVGLKLKQLSRQFQVLCISHLAQVAAYADAHFRVEKMAKGARTESHIVRLSSSESAKEIARILSGTEITDPSIKNAKSLVERAKRASQSITPAERL